MARKRVVRAVEQEDDRRVEALPLFPDVEGVDHLVVYRLEPQEDEGHIGQAEPTITEEGLKAKYGGGKYRLTPRDAGSQYVNGKGVRTVKLGGEPVWSNDIARRKYMKAHGMEDPRPAPPAGERQPSMMEMMLFMEKSSERVRLEAREQAALREREAGAAHERQLALVKADAERREKELQLQREQMATQLAAERQRDQQFMQTMISIVKGEARAAASGGDTLEQAGKLVSLMRELGGGGEGGAEDPMANLTRNLPAIMQQLRLMSPGAAPAAGAKRPAGPEPLTIEGPLGAEANKVFGEIAKRGGDPSAVFAQVLQELRRRLAAAPAPAATNGKAQTKGAGTAPAPPSATRPRKTARPKTTARPKAATR